ncbi:hypothetical protein LXM25_21395 [Dyadobacter sp. LJ53]|uniref:glycoside hydrolase family 2 TIM barrel-domain containing protein n=1 Tax=Dyadobacter chenwenxiniae TaxID=2906456 RepID=UPI001F246AA9|nr:glycoside hydrolase family 2 TIM barrel-domain containing protein [Dyadobacter chenwenxiniae]MCF0052641.1 hypothetical protein [Dyadobacter chenwenxiniae]
MNLNKPFSDIASLISSGNNIVYSIIFTTCLYVTLLACQDVKENSAATVRIVKSDSGYVVLRNGKAFGIKGASGASNFQTLHEAGGNCVRIWDTTHLQQILDSAHANNIAVIAGLPMQNSDQIDLYNDPVKVLQQLSQFQSLIDRHKNHPALLMWCLGNELDFPYNPSYNNFYDAFNAITKMIRHLDPNHPVTTTVLNFNQKYIANIQLRCDLDLISFNIFNNISLLKEDLKSFSWFWNGPYMLLEWGTDGPWTGTQRTAWGAFIENPSKKKADVILNRYRQEMPLKDPRLVGNFIFYWGSKQETTHTWFSIFDESGRKSEPVAIMESIWTGKLPQEHYPQIRYMLLNNKGAADNILLNPGEMMRPELVMHEKDSIMSVQWEIFTEDWYKENGQNSTRKLLPLDRKIEPAGKLTTEFTSPMEEGPYRIFAKIYDYNGNFATCNTPFYVVSDR